MIKQKLFENFAHPRGVYGRLAGRIMAAKKSNTARGRWAVAELAPKPDARVLEVGYGPGVAIEAMAARVPNGRVVGVDASEVMFAQASRRNAEEIRSGRVELRVGDARGLDADLTDFDLVYGINVWQFWPNPTAVIAELRERLAPHGRLALVYMQPPSGSVTSARSEFLMKEQFAEAGLVDIEVDTMDFEPPAVMVIGHA
jgi:ubiquinone/menaquinone biosynthesis C-methylase UbiE